MKKFLLSIALLATTAFVFAQATQPENDANVTLDKLIFNGVVNVELQPNYSDGNLYMIAEFEYNVPHEKFITISEMSAKVIVMDETISQYDLSTFAYSDFCDINNKTEKCALRDFFKKYECGTYVNTTTEKSPRRSEVFDGGKHTKKMLFNFGPLVNMAMSKAASDRMTPDGYVYPNQFVVNQVDMNRLFRLSNNLNGPMKNDSKLIIVAEGNANYNGADGTVRLEYVHLAVVMSRVKVAYLYENPAHYNKREN